jgi:choline dehydrogenase-like flavoprotein
MAPSPDDWLAPDGTSPSSGGTPPLDVHLAHPRPAVEALERARDDLVDLLNRSGLQPRVRLWHVEPPCTSVHYGGTCRMHASSAYGMIDAWSRMHTVRNVVVADSSAFTTGPEKNPVLTSMALAARAGDRLAQEMRSGDI